MSARAGTVLGWTVLDDGTRRYVALCWDGKVRTTVVVHPPSQLNPLGGISYRDKFYLMADVREGMRHLASEAPRWAVDYL